MFFLELRFATGRLAAVNTLLEFAVQVFIRIQLWRIRWQVKHLNHLFVLLKPFLYRLCMMHLEVIHYHNNLALCLFGQTPQKINQDVSVHCAVEDTEANLALIGNR